MSGSAQYLLALFICEHRQDPPIRTGTVADRLDRTPASATEMMKDLAEEGYVEYEPYEGATLTEAGRERAEELHETYAALSWFFRGVLELEDHERQALEIAGTLGPDAAERLADSLLSSDPDELPDRFSEPSAGDESPPVDAETETE
ncbi:metal-dependent transcriptional regulator [Halobaculum roseum]|uniref:Metal-dependent transcriptional regulator n=1 Tax=Halobaculum roseum TaxID=2175149 RepID=A0ABD5MTW4_9EURY|nr:metal-dependent transcriptional regulator [Halobaculum roseum]QZY04559.1 metal-dependent transcriptional regulator [Halobaculum roseum]